MKALAEYPTHHYIYEYVLVDMYCPNCGVEGGVYCESGMGDYYCGPSYLCVNCEHGFTIQGPNKSDHVHLKVIDQIKTGVMMMPSTPKGR